METIYESISINPFERPRYTRHELGKTVYEKRIKQELSLEKVASAYQIKEDILTRIENGSCAFNVKMYKFILAFLNLPKEEILAKDVNDTSLLFSTLKNVDPAIRKVVEDVNVIFQEMVMQEKINTSIEVKK